MKCKGPSCMGCSDAQCYSKGGKVHGTPTDSQVTRGGRDADVRGVNKSVMRGDPGTSMAGSYVGGHGYGSNTETAKSLHRDTLNEQRSMKKPNLYADGGVVDLDGDSEAIDNELSDMACGELLDAIQKKDKSGILEAIRAIVLSVR